MIITINNQTFELEDSWDDQILVTFGNEATLFDTSEGVSGLEKAIEKLTGPKSDKLVEFVNRAFSKVEEFKARMERYSIHKIERLKVKIERFEDLDTHDLIKFMKNEKYFNETLDSEIKDYTTVIENYGLV
jgi:hypothetical protein